MDLTGKTMKAFLLAAILLVPVSAFAQSEAEVAYCKYVAEQAASQRDLLRTPSGLMGPIQPSTGTPPQLVFGVSDSLSDVMKSGLVMKAAKTNCNLYKATTEAQQHLIYALPRMEKDILRHRLDLIQAASDKLDAIIADNMKLVEAQNVTRPALYALEGAKVRLDTSRTAALTGIASPYVPPLSDVPIKVLITVKLAAESANLQATDKLEKQSSWDIKLSGGAHRQISAMTPGVSSFGAYGEFNLSYNLGRRAITRHIDQSEAAYVNWKQTQFDDVANQAAVLKHQIIDTLEIERTELVILHSHDKDLEANLRSLEGLDTSNAIAFRNQLIADQMILRVEIADVEFRISRLQEFLDANF
ncbi:MAG: hypothetical protein AUH11_03030 [Acidobacteria bacterium 13_2_20CM_57_17]|nr:MAG: hypothetical protein AUH11_03030 [Acidobacteria bacterium 13_2_20CM_57_17]OLB95111.1 MAG: hypothetical protein AUI02_04135 [Acidobacteria bacterium 13_2_20CM_2_57_12]OLE16468.1 MAG: hypothetical protein AUG83_02865 [Acidobacteria bacterium 13_1_20CM_4_57_11]